MFKNLTEIQKKLIKIIIFGFIIVGLLFLTIWLMRKVTGGKLSYDKIEDKMVSAAEKYYEANEDLLPKEEVSKVEVDAETLAKKGYMQDLNSYTDKNVSCSGKVVVLRNGDNYDYIPKLDCGEDYNTLSLAKKLIDTDLVTESDGLYEIDGEYVYRGEKLNNYVKFAGMNFRVLRITSDNEIRLIQVDNVKQEDWDNRYNAEKKTTAGINDFNVSRIKDNLEEIYNGETFKAKDKAKIIPKQLCIGKRYEDDASKSGYTECDVLTEEYYPLGLIQLNEFLIASIDEGCVGIKSRQCTNYNFLAGFNKNYWTLTANKSNTYQVYYIDIMPQIGLARKPAGIKLVINISGEINYASGNGTLEEPYVID